MPDWDMNGDTTRTGYEAQIASLKAELDQAIGIINDRNAEIGRLNEVLAAAKTWRKQAKPRSGVAVSLVYAIDALEEN